MRLSLAALIIALAALPAPVTAAYQFDVREVGPNVVITGFGSLNTSAVAAGSSFPAGGAIGGNSGLIVAGFSNGAIAYSGLTGPDSFGSGRDFIADIDTGIGVGVRGTSFFVGPGYISGSQLGISTATFNNRSFASLGLLTGNYVYVFGSGAAADSITVNIGQAVPEASTWAMMTLGFAAIGFAMRRKKVSHRIRFV